MEIQTDLDLIQETEFFQVPRYLLFRKYSEKDMKHILDLGAGFSYYRLNLGLQAFTLFCSFIQPSSPKEVAQKLGLPIKDVLSACSLFLKEKVLCRYQTIPEKFKRYDRNLLYYRLNSVNPLRAQEILSKITIVLIGVGGIGNWVSLNLIGLGLKKLRLVDADLIEKSNLCRQVLFSEADIGKKKVDVAKQVLEGKNSSVLLETVDAHVTEENVEELIRGADFVVLSADSPPYFIQKWVNRACVRNNIPFFNVGYADGLGIVGPLVAPPITACLACDNFLERNKPTVFIDKNIKDQTKNNLLALLQNYQAPSFTCLNSLVSCIASYEIVKYFLDFGQCDTNGYRLFIDPLEIKVDKKKYEINENCKICRPTY